MKGRVLSFWGDLVAYPRLSMAFKILEAMLCSIFELPILRTRLISSGPILLSFLVPSIARKNCSCVNIFKSNTSVVPSYS